MSENTSAEQSTEKHLAISFASEHNLPFLAMAAEIGVTHAQFIATTKSTKENWTDGIKAVLKKRKITCYKNLEVEDEYTNSVKVLSNLLIQAIKAFYYKHKDGVVSLSVTGGLKSHIISVWNAFIEATSLLKPQQIFVQFPDLQRNTLETYYHSLDEAGKVIIEEGTIKNLPVVGLEERLELYPSFKLNAENSLKIISNGNKTSYSEIKKYFTRINTDTEHTKDSGNKYEYQLINHIYSSAEIINNIKEMWWSIELKDTKTNFVYTEYDIMIITKTNKVFIIECKSTNERKLLFARIKEQESNKARWGGRFSSYIVATPLRKKENETDQSYLKSVTTFWEQCDSMGIGLFQYPKSESLGLPFFKLEDIK